MNQINIAIRHTMTIAVAIPATFLLYSTPTNAYSLECIRSRGKHICTQLFLQTMPCFVDQQLLPTLKAQGAETSFKEGVKIALETQGKNLNLRKHYLQKWGLLNIAKGYTSTALLKLCPETHEKMDQLKQAYIEYSMPSQKRAEKMTVELFKDDVLYRVLYSESNQDDISKFGSLSSKELEDIRQIDCYVHANGESISTDPKEQQLLTTYCQENHSF